MAGDRVRITTQLIEVETDSHLWSESYDRELSDIFAVQDEIAAKSRGSVEGRSVGRPTPARSVRAAKPRSRPTATISSPGRSGQT